MAQAQWRRLVACLFYYVVEHQVMTEPLSIRTRFPGPWKAEETPGGFRVVDASATPLAYLYAPAEGRESALPGRTLSRAEARAIAEAISRLVG